MVGNLFYCGQNKEIPGRMKVERFEPTSNLISPAFTVMRPLQQLLLTTEVLFFYHLQIKVLKSLQTLSPSLFLHYVHSIFDRRHSMCCSNWWFRRPNNWPELLRMLLSLGWKQSCHPETRKMLTPEWSHFSTYKACRTNRSRIASRRSSVSISMWVFPLSICWK